MSDQFNARSVRDIYLQRRTVTSYCQAVCLLELLMIKCGILLVPGIVFYAGDIDDVMRDMCDAVFFRLVLCVLCVRLHNNNN